VGFFKKKHIPQGARKQGLRSRFIYYPIGVLSALIIIFLISYGHISSAIFALNSSINATTRIFDEIHNKSKPVKKVYTEEDAENRFREMAYEKYPTPASDKERERLFFYIERGYAEGTIPEYWKKRSAYYKSLISGMDNTLKRWNKESEEIYNKECRRWKKEENWSYFDVYKFSLCECPNAISTILFFMASVMLSFHFIGSSSRFAIIDTLSIFPKHLFLFLSLPFIILHMLSLIYLEVEVQKSLFYGFLAYGLPPLSLVFMVYLTIFIESLKETTFYREIFIEGKGREISRWGSFGSYHRYDISVKFRRAQKKIRKLKKSLFYLGKTKWLYDYKIGCRHIGTDSEQHLIIVAGTGAGKSRDILNNNTLTYSGGMVIFDVKGEHVATSYKKRSQFAKAYVIDPWEVNKLGIPTDHWNPLAAIDIHSKDARARISRICQSIVIKEGSSEKASDTHFRETPQKILRGFIAHVLSKYPKEYHNLPSVYNLMFTGDIKGGAMNEKAMKDIIEAMSENDICEGSPIAAAADIIKLESASAEKSGVWNTLSRSLDWVKDPNIRNVISGKNTFSFDECKQGDATVYLVIPEIFLSEQKRFTKLFYQCAFDELNEHFTPQPANHERRVLFIFDEFEVLGNFDRARQAALRERGSFIKCVFIVQNFGQFETNYANQSDFLTNCDKLVFGVDRSDTKIMEMLKKALGSYTDILPGEHEHEKIRPLMSEGEIADFMNIKRKGLLFIPVGGFPLKLNRTHYDSIFWEYKRGGIIKRCIGNYKYAKEMFVKYKASCREFLIEIGFFEA